MKKFVVGVFDELTHARMAEGGLNRDSIFSEIYDNRTFDPAEHEGGTEYFRLLLGGEENPESPTHLTAFEAGAFLLVADAETQEQSEHARITLHQAGAKNIHVIERRLDLNHQ